LQEAVDLTPKDHSAYVGQLESLRNGYQDRSINKGTEADLNMAIQYLQEAVDLTPKDHLDCAGQLESLRHRYQHRSIIKGIEIDFD
jgi:hypothetical protein